MAALAVRPRRGRGRSRRGGSATPTRRSSLSLRPQEGRAAEDEDHVPPGFRDHVVVAAHTQQQWPASLLQCCRGVRLAPCAGWTPAPERRRWDGDGPRRSRACYAVLPLPHSDGHTVAWCGQWTVPFPSAPAPAPHARSRVCPLPAWWWRQSSPTLPPPRAQLARLEWSGGECPSGSLPPTLTREIPSPAAPRCLFRDRGTVRVRAYVRTRTYSTGGPTPLQTQPNPPACAASE